MSSSTRRSVFSVLLAILLCGFLGIGYSQRISTSGSSESEVRENLRQFSEIYDLVEQNYAEPVNPDKAIYNDAIPGMLHVREPHSKCVDPKPYSDMHQD